MDITVATKILSDCAALIQALEQPMVDKLIADIGERQRKTVLGLERIDIAADGSLNAVIALGWVGDPDYEIMPIEVEDLAGINL